MDTNDSPDPGAQGSMEDSTDQLKKKLENELRAAVAKGASSALTCGAGIARSATQGIRDGIDIAYREVQQRGERSDQNPRVNDLETNLHEASEAGRWIEEEEKLHLIRQAEAEKEEKRSRDLLESKKGFSALLICIAWFVPFLWPLAIAGTIAIFPKTSKKIGIGALGLAGVVILTVAVNGVLQGIEQKNQEESASTSKVFEEHPAAISEPNTNGKRIADRLEEECDYWGIDRYNPDGTATISKSIYTTWGGRQVMMIPRASWNALSRTEKSDLASYVSQSRGITSIIVGEVRLSDKTGRNTLTVDETIWP
jgi:hypothetical protein